MADGLRRSIEEQDMTDSPIFREVLHHTGEARTVLDIGAGIGRFTVPLVRAGCRVMAVEPSREMRKQLEKIIALQDVSESVRIVPEAWPRDSSLQAEVALAAFVIQFSNRPIEFVRAMEASATKRCVLAVHVDSMFGVLNDLWPQFHPDRKAPQMLVFADIYPMLLQAGITANVEIMERQQKSRFRDQGTALAMLAGRLEIQQDETAKARLQTWIEEEWDSLIKPRRMRSAVISWTPERV